MEFLPEQLYHIYNRGNNKQRIFFDDGNYHFFLRKFCAYLGKYCKLLAYCLMPNHFHFMIFTNYDLEVGKLNSGIGLLLRTYTRAINIQEQRCGFLFQQKTKAKCLNKQGNRTQSYSIDYGISCLNYIHQNPLKAKLVKKMEDWKYSSFTEYIGINKNKFCDTEFCYKILDLPPRDLFYKMSYEIVEAKQLSGIL